MVSASLAVLAVAASTIFSGAFAQPHRRHMQKHARDVTVIEYATAPVVNVVVYVDQFGNTLSRVENGAGYAPTEAPVPTTTSAAMVTSKKTRKHTVKHTKTKYTTTQSTTAAPTSSPIDSATLGKGLVYSPYHNDGSCKSNTDVVNEMNTLFSASNDYNWARIYGTDCDQVTNVLGAAKSLGVKVMLGIYDIDDDTKFQTELSQLCTAVKAVDPTWSSVALVSVGNEYVNNNGGSAASVSLSVSRAAEVRSALQADGYTGSVANADVWWRVMANPELCGEDVLLPVNIHPFFDQNCPVENAGNFLATQIANVQAACPGKTVLISETGWPTAGSSTGQSVPSQANQATFLELASQNVKVPYMLLTAYNELWKPNGDLDVEHYWGIYGDSPSS